MRRGQGLMGIVALLAWTGAANAQVFFPSASGFGVRTFSSTSFRHHHHFSTHRFYSFGIGFYPYYPYFGSSFFAPDLYWYSYPATVPSSPLVINLPAQERRQPAEEELPKGKVLIKPGPQKAKEEAKPGPALPGVDASVFRPIRAADRERALQPIPAEEPKPAAPPEPVEARPPETSPPVPNPVAPAADPKDLIQLGKEVFAAREYGRAERFFRQASMKEPKEPLAFFLLAQVRFALSKNQEAVEAIHAGLQLKSDWPQSDFQPLLLYGSNAADFQEQLEHLKEVVANNPNEPALAFLYGYQLWFAGRKVEAKPFFLKLQIDAKEKDFVTPFLPDRQRPAPAKN